MKRHIPILLALMLLLSGCSSFVPIAEEKEQSAPQLTEEDVSSFGSEDEGFCLTYPSSFTLTSSGDDYYEFKDEENDLSITLSIEENKFSGLSAEEYPQAMDMEMYSKMLSDNGFDRDIYVKDDSSYYYIYKLTDDNIYCLEYAYNGDENEDDLIDLLNLEVYDDFTGSDNTETLRSYAMAYLEDLTGSAEGYTMEYSGKDTIRSGEFDVFEAYKSNELYCLIAVNDSGVCYVDKSGSGLNYVNIEHLLYDTETSEEDKLKYSAKHYYEALFDTQTGLDSFELYDSALTYDGVTMTVYEVKDSGKTLCLIGVTSDGTGYVDYSATGSSFEKIEK